MNNKEISGEICRICGRDHAYWGYRIDTSTNKVTYYITYYISGCYVGGQSEKTFDDYAEAKEFFDNLKKGM